MNKRDGGRTHIASEPFKRIETPTLWSLERRVTKLENKSEVTNLEREAAIEWARDIVAYSSVPVIAYTPLEKGWLRLLGQLNDARRHTWNRACTILESNNLLERHDKVVEGGNPEWVRVL